MDCPICCEAITKESGQVTTSCGHNFHLKCLNHWYYRQYNEDATWSCPCCRKEPGEFEQASVVEDQDEEEDAESETISQATGEILTDWIRIGERRWVIPSSDDDRLRILAQVAAQEPKEDPLRIPPYDGEAHALWILRHLFDENQVPAQPMESIHILDKPKMYRRRRRSFGRTFWCHLGREYSLDSIDGYYTD